MRRLVRFGLLVASLSISAKTKTVILGYTIDLDEPDSIVVDLKDGSFKKISMKDFHSNYVYKRMSVGSEATIVSGSSEPLCLGGWVYLTNSRNNADFVVKETSANDYDCAIRIVDKSSPDCDEWRITSERALAKHKVYIAPQNELGYDYKVRIIR